MAAITHASHTLYLRSDVVWCSTEGLGGDSVVHIFFTHAKICNLNVTLTVQHHVVKLQVSTGGNHSVKGEQFITQRGPGGPVISKFAFII